MQAPTVQPSLADRLLDRLPTFDPTWDQFAVSNWMDVFNRIAALAEHVSVDAGAPAIDVDAIGAAIAAHLIAMLPVFPPPAAPTLEPPLSAELQDAAKLIVTSVEQLLDDRLVNADARTLNQAAAPAKIAPPSAIPALDPITGRRRHAGRLPDALVRAIEQGIDDGLTYDEIAAKTGLPKTTIGYYGGQIRKRRAQANPAPAEEEQPIIAGAPFPPSAGANGNGAHGDGRG